MCAAAYGREAFDTCPGGAARLLCHTQIRLDCVCVCVFCFNLSQKQLNDRSSLSHTHTHTRVMHVCEQQR